MKQKLQPRRYFEFLFVLLFYLHHTTGHLVSKSEYSNISYNQNNISNNLHKSNVSRRLK